MIAAVNVRPRCEIYPPCPHRDMGRYLSIIYSSHPALSQILHPFKLKQPIFLTNYRPNSNSLTRYRPSHKERKPPKMALASGSTGSSASSIGSSIGTIAQSGLSPTAIIIIIVVALLAAIVVAICIGIKNKHASEHSSEIYISEEELSLHEKMMERRRIRETALPTPSPRSSLECPEGSGGGGADGGRVIPPWERSQRGEGSTEKHGRNGSRHGDSARRSQERSLLLEGGRDGSDQQEQSEDSERQSGGRLRIPEPTVPPRSPRTARYSV